MGSLIDDSKDQTYKNIIDSDIKENTKENTKENIKENIKDYI